MSEIKLKLDPCNPGQFYACCGLLELANAPGTVARFVCEEARPRSAEFIIWGAEIPDMTTVLRWVHQMKCDPIEAAEESVRPLRALVGRWAGELDWWLDDFREKATSLKGWAGQVTTQKLFTELPALLDPALAASDPIKFAAMTKSKFGVDPRSAWNALDLGYSPNVHNQDAVTYPAVELLAAIGLQGFRPNAQSRDVVRYSLWTEPLPASVARLAASAPWAGLPRYEYWFAIERRGSYKYFTFGKFDNRKD